jgi:hypothetical protein
MSLHESYPGREIARPFVNWALLWMQVICQLFQAFLLPIPPDLPSIHLESRPAGLVMAVTDI